MPFNSKTYYLNRYRKDRDAAMAAARARRARIAREGEGYPGERDMIASDVRRARHCSTMLRLQKRIIAIGRGEL